MARWVSGWGHSLTTVMEKSWNLQNRQNMSCNFTTVAYNFEQRDGNEKGSWLSHGNVLHLILT